MQELFIDSKEKSDKVFYGQSFVAFLDILGFKSLVTYNSHEDLVKIYEELIAKVVTDIQNIEKEVEASIRKKLDEHYEPVGIRLINISDSIIIWTQNCREGSLYSIIMTVRSLLALSFKLGIPLRGVISMGDLSAIEKGESISLVGSGLVNAYLHEASYNWAGVVIDEGIFNYLESFYRVVLGHTNPRNYGTWSNEMTKYNVPTKSGHKNHFVVNWCNLIPFEEQEIVNAFARHKKRERESDELRESNEIKIKNTVDFWRQHKPSK